MNILKVRISSFVVNILENDARRFGFEKGGDANKNALVNKLMPILVDVRKARRNEIEKILTNEYNRDDSEKIYSAVNTVIDRVYFNETELNALAETLWIRVTKDVAWVYDEIETSEVMITAQEVPVYVRGLLNEYALLPQYKREALVFDSELEIFDEACEERTILHFRNRATGERCKAFAFMYVYGYLYDQTNYCIIYDIDNNKIKAIPLCEIGDAYKLKQKFKPSDRLLERLQEYTFSYRFDEEIEMGDE